MRIAVEKGDGDEMMALRTVDRSNIWTEAIERGSVYMQAKRPQSMWYNEAGL